MRTVAIDNTDEVAFQSETAEEDCLRHIGESFKRLCCSSWNLLKLHGELERQLNH